MPAPRNPLKRIESSQTWKYIQKVIFKVKRCQIGEHERFFLGTVRESKYN